jgi:soluble lytic murein transglycosylase
MRRHILGLLLASAMSVLGAVDASTTPDSKHPPPRKTHAATIEHHKHGLLAKRSAAAERHQHEPAATEGRKGAAAEPERHKHGALAKRSVAGRHVERTRESRAPQPDVPLPAERPATASLPPDLAAAKQAIELVRQRKPADATALATASGDPVVRKVVEWTLLRNSDNDVEFERYAAFIHNNPDWPSIPLHRRAEARLWYDRRDAATVRRFFVGEPTSALGRLAFARMLKSEGDRASAAREVRAVWQSGELSSDQESAALDTFHDELTRADNVVRMDDRIGAKDFGAAMRAAKRVGDDEVAIVKACEAAETNDTKAKALLAEVPGGARGDLGFVLCQVHWLLQHDEIAAAAKLVLASSPDDLIRQDTDEWWRERRLLARRLIDLGDSKTAYSVAHEAALPANPYYRAEFHFMSGWIALRYLGDPATALKHFDYIDRGSDDPIVRARAAYWRGRAAEAAGHAKEMRGQYEAAARYPTAYYGQLARARLGFGEIAVPRTPPEPVHSGTRELSRALEILYAIGERDLAQSFVTDLADESSDAAMLSALGQITARYNDARAMLVLGKTALARGLTMDHYAFPDIGVPPYKPITSEIDRCLVYSIVRTESAFDQHDKSPANAVGLMQVTPEAGRDTAKRFGVTYDWNRLVSDPVYNMQMGAAELSALLKEYNGSYIMAFAGYNAGRGRVREWVARHGDPRDPKVDAVDWVERIPLAETRNYVQRVMENLQIYRTRFGASIATVEPNLHRATRVESSAEPGPE